MSLPATIRDSVVDVINGTDFSQEFTAEVSHTPKFDLFSSQTIQVQVVASSDTRDMGTTATDEAEIVIDVGVFKKLQNAISAEATEIDGLLDVCEEIRAALNRVRVDGVGTNSATCILIEQTPLYGIEELDEHRAFLSVLKCTFSDDPAV